MNNGQMRQYTEKLSSYKNTKLELADHLRSVMQALKDLNREEVKKQYEELMVKLAEDRFVLGVVGEFKRGKSSLMNAIIGRNLLPVGVLPVTSIITTLRYGVPEKLIIERYTSSLPEELPVAMLPDYITLKGNPENKKDIKNVYVELPVPFLQKGIEFVDTPGIGSVIAAHTITTYDFLPTCDAVLFVTSADMPISDTELNFLNRLKKYCDKIFFIVNKIDVISDNDRNDILDFAIQTISKQMDNNLIKVFPLSSLQALQAKTTNNNLLYKQSGLQTLEEELTGFLSDEKSETFLKKISSVALQILDKTQLLNISTNDMPADSYEAINIIEEKYNQIKTLHEVLSHKQKAFPTVQDKHPSLAKPSNTHVDSIAATRKQTGDINSEAILADFNLRSCPVCSHIAREVNIFLSGFQYQLVTNENTRDQFATQLGFCPLHTWQLLSISSPYGASIGFARLSEEIANRLQEFMQHQIQEHNLQNMVKHTANCFVCEILKDREVAYIKRLSAILNTDEGRHAYSNSEGVCLWHLSMLTNIISTADLKDFLLTHAAQSFRQDAEDMRTYVLKRDALKRSLLNQNEKDAYLRAAIRMVGDRAVCTPWAMDGDI